MRRYPLPVLATLLLLAFGLSACGTELDSRGETLRIIATGLDPAYVNEAYSADIRVAGGLTPYSFLVSAGALPPGLSLQGGSVRGTPSETGSFSFTITVSDGNLSRTFQEYSLNVTEPPTAELSLNVPLTEVQRPLTLRGVVSEARNLQALRTLITWDPALFTLVPESVSASSETYALFSESAEGRLQVDLAVLGGTVSGERQLFAFTLAPLERTTLGVNSETEFLSDTGRHGYQTRFEGLESDLGLGEESLPPEDEPEPQDDPQEGENGGDL